jgi:hypothetical protein
MADRIERMFDTSRLAARDASRSTIHHREEGHALDAKGRSTGGVVTGLPLVLLRLEGAALLAAAIYGYAEFGRSWLLFALLLLVPDLGMLGYIANPRIGAITYDLFHTSVGPMALLVVGIAVDGTSLTAIAIIWFAHIGLDRALGYGLKYDDGFGSTHLGGIGRH